MDLGENMLQLVWERDLCLDVFGVLPKLQVLHLNNNYLSALPQEIFRGLPSLKRLYLASNLLSHLSPGLFPKSLTNLNLSGNQLFSPEPEVFMTFNILDITHNNYVCGCALKSLLVWLNETDVTLAGSQSDRPPLPLKGYPCHILRTMAVIKMDSRDTQILTLHLLLGHSSHVSGGSHNFYWLLRDLFHLV